VSWLKRIFRKDDGEEPSRAETPSPAAHAKKPVRPKSEPGTGYGANPYDTYTWELHTDDDGERKLKRAHIVDRKKDKDGETFNPYDTGKFSGGW